tara:strand:- start:25101 stop:25763 length:663 start_codon:yes stop_codon:yes gene_type:complete
MKSPFASLNWGVFQPESGYVLILTQIAASGGMDSETSLHGKNTKVYTTFASAFEQLFQQAAQQMDNRAEWFLENIDEEIISGDDITNELGLDSAATIFDLQGYYNEAPQTADLTIFSIHDNQYIDNSQKPFRQLCRDVWKRLSKLESFRAWDDYRALARRTLTDTEREQLNQAFERFIDLIPPMNLTGIMSFKTEFLDDYYSSETQINIHLLPRNMEGRA